MRQMTKIDSDQASKIMKHLMVEDFIVEASSADWWEMRFSGGFILNFHAITFPEEEALNQFLTKAPVPLLNGADPQEVAQVAMIYSLKRQPIADAYVTETDDIVITFENQRRLEINARVDIVDCAWRITTPEPGKTPPAPFAGGDELACYFPGDLWIEEAFLSYARSQMQQGSGNGDDGNASE
ncbi:hypothetical protein SCOR_05285 [Sulfidibacter corallicola]|uniref:Uncharacterized protein n=1 Tax=Sulfidibacter corallicola TaxID=2818388 RepID=A0A8A4TQJ9_SULCO|nr:hypothetical protein [Sulfidibacter corallicola]QTD51813.1 hypothetical protein J3U87_05025 [Sulfidibacter corallicola]